MLFHCFTIPIKVFYVWLSILDWFELFESWCLERIVFWRNDLSWIHFILKKICQCGLHFCTISESTTYSSDMLFAVSVVKMNRDKTPSPRSRLHPTHTASNWTDCGYWKGPDRRHKNTCMCVATCVMMHVVLFFFWTGLQLVTQFSVKKTTKQPHV